MRVHALIHFTKKIHYRDTSMTKLQCYVINKVTKKEFWLSFNTGHFLYNRIHNTSHGYNEPFDLYITYNTEGKNRVKEMTGEQYKNFERQFPEHII